MFGRCCLGSLDAAVLRAVNDMWESIAPSVPSSTRLKEACTRVSAVRKGGIWVVARRLQSREVILVFESCSSLNDMSAMFNGTVNGVLSSIVM